MFQFPRFPSSLLYIQRVIPEVRSGGFPHSDIPGYIACSRLPEAFRSDPRPSSALGTKASTVSLCSFPRDTENTILFLPRPHIISSMAILRCALHLHLPYSAVKVRTRLLAAWRPLAGLIRSLRCSVKDGGHSPTLGFLDKSARLTAGLVICLRITCLWG